MAEIKILILSLVRPIIKNKKIKELTQASAELMNKRKKNKEKKRRWYDQVQRRGSYRREPWTSRL
jgi:hypothetical protein